MSKKNNETSKKEIIDAFIEHKQEMLEDFRSNQKMKLDQSSSGDMDNKHHESKTEETLNELELLNHNVDILEKEISLLRNIPINSDADHVQFGSLVYTDLGLLLVGAANESMDIKNNSVRGISTSAPIFKQMMGLSKGNSFELNGNKHHVIDVK